MGPSVERTSKQVLNHTRQYLKAADLRVCSHSDICGLGGWSSLGDLDCLDKPDYRLFLPSWTEISLSNL